VVVDGEVLKPRSFAIEDLLKLAPMEERIYRHRCVEAWSMVIPWIGYPLSSVLKAVQPTGKAKYVKFATLLDPKQMSGQNDRVLHWPYEEALRIDEAMHPLALLTFGLYGEVLPNQNGAPLRMVIPWKYGFKGAKSIVRITLVEKQPVTAWMRAVPDWYGFYSNVNPNVSPQNWSQATERRIGQGAFGGLFEPRMATQMFNGYGAQVAHLYAGMDLTKNF
jgi:sulfoxide reductase catalytic subunit YedY